MTPAQKLYEAIKNGDLTESSALVASNRSLVEGGGPAGMPPLMLSIYMKQPAIAEMLLAHGAMMDAYAAAALGKTAELQVWCLRMSRCCGSTLPMVGQCCIWHAFLEIWIRRGC